MKTQDAIGMLVIFLLAAGLAVAGWWRTVQGGAGNFIPAVALSCTITAAIVGVSLAKALWAQGMELMIWPRGVSTRDDRGHTVWLHEPHWMATEVEMTPQLERELEAWTKVHPPSSARFVLACLAIPIAAALVTYLVVHAIWPGVRWYWTTLIGFATAPFVWRWAACERRRWRAPFFISVGRCASCGYEISQLRPESDGCVVCPECGAAWKRGAVESS